jgi:hypothetical protein
MATTIKDTGALHILNPDALYVTPLVKGSNGEYTKEGAQTTYKLKEVIRDTTTITQEDPTENKIENEFGSAPIESNMQLGNYTFSAEVADMQQDLLVDLCGYIKGEDTDRTFAPTTYSSVYAEIALVFNAGGGKYVAAVLPKVLLNSKATFDSLSTSMGRITLAGTAQNIKVSDGTGTKETPFYIDSNWTTEEL